MPPTGRSRLNASHGNTRRQVTALGALVTIVALTAAACGSNIGVSQSPDTSPAPPEQPASSASGSSSGGSIQEDPNHRVVVVNLTRDGSNPGPAFDLVQVPQDAAGLAPKVEGLAYGKASPAIRLGRKASSFDTGDYGLTLVPSGSSSGSTAEVVTPPPTPDWNTAIVVAGGNPKSPSFLKLYSDPVGTGSNSIPASETGKVVLVASKAEVGDPNTGGGITDSVLFGPPGSCLPSIDPKFAGDAADEVTKASAFAVPAGTATVGFWTSTKNQWTPADCAGPPVATADVSALGGGDRAVVLLYGPSQTKLSTLVVKAPT